MQLNPAEPTISRARTWTDWLLATGLLAGALCMFGWLFWCSGYGFDFTDEAFYLNWMRRPSNYAASATQFGFVYRPLYWLVGEDIVALRQANIALTAALGMAATWILLKTHAGDTSTRGRYERLAIAAAISTSGLTTLVFAGMWLPTPSYNTLVFQGLLVTLCGIFAIEGEECEHSMIGWVVVGIGGWLCFMGKPSSAAALAVVVVAYVVLTGRWRSPAVLAAAATALLLLLLSAFVIDGSVPGFINRLMEGVRIGTLLDEGVSKARLFRLDEFSLDRETWIGVLIAFALSALVLALVWAGTLSGLGAVANCVACAVILCGLTYVFRIALPPQTPPHPYKTLVLIALSAGAIPVAALRAAVSRRLPAWRNLALAAALIAIPYVFAFGTSNTYWLFIAAGGIFFAFAAIVLIDAMLPRHEAKRALLLFGIAIQYAVLMILLEGLTNPYRQPSPLWQNAVAVDIPAARSKLLLSKPAAEYLASAQRVAQAHGFVAGTPMLDLSGMTPGLVYLLDGNAIGVAWTLGGSSGTAEFLKQSFRHVPCEQFARAWLITEPDGLKTVPREVLESVGLDAERDFESVGSFQTPGGSMQYLLRPLRSAEAARAMCEKARRETT